MSDKARILVVDDHPSNVNAIRTKLAAEGHEILEAIHYNGERHKGRFLAVNCGAFSEGLLESELFGQESELFGHKRGSFTGATEDKVGLFEAAAGGSVFLDEISETSSWPTRSSARSCSPSRERRLA